MSETVEPEIYVGVSAWIIRDGNYCDFTVGDQAKFALEFSALNELRPVPEGPLRAEHLGASRYRVRARVVFVAEGVWVIETGAFMAFQERPTQNTHVGAFVEGDVYVGIDPFFYFEGLYKIPRMPPLSCRWVIREIQRETTPLREIRLPTGTRTSERDETKESFAPVAATNAWDDGGEGHYVLSCTREGGPEMP